jgi:hypothetical protein
MRKPVNRTMVQVCGRSSTPSTRDRGEGPQRGLPRAGPACSAEPT